MAITYKTKEEIEKLHHAGTRLAYILRSLGETARPGVSIADLDILCEKLILEQGDKPAFKHYRPQGAPRPFPASICISVNDVVVHGIPNENPVTLEQGDVVSLDAGLIRDGLVVDATISVGVGKIDADAVRLLRCSEEALAAGIEAARLGNRVGDISASIQSTIHRLKFSSPYEFGGHGVGYKVHEEPNVPNQGRPGSGPELKVGMVLAIEPIVMEFAPRITIDNDGWTIRSLDGGRSAQFEHTVAITEEGPRILTQEY